MQKWILVTALFLAGCATGNATTNGSHRVAIVAIGDVDRSLVSHAKEWTEQNTALNVDIAHAMKLEGQTFDDVAAQAGRTLNKTDIYVVALAMMPTNITSHGMRTPSGTVSVLNVRAMQADNPSETILEKRIERQTLRAISLMLDLQTCPNPQCVLATYSTLSDLDRSGRNLCPPCLGHLQKNAARHQLEVDTNNPFYLPP